MQRKDRAEARKLSGGSVCTKNQRGVGWGRIAWVGALLGSTLACGQPAVDLAAGRSESALSANYHDKDLLSLTATEAMAALESGEITSLEYVNALLRRVEQHPEVNAFIHLDPDQVRAAAAAADAARASGEPVGPLHGLPILLKDNINTADMPTTGGTPALAGNQPAENAPVAQALIDAGAIIMGKTNMHELAFGITSNNAAFGPVRNPYDLDRMPGGSSGGNGAALAARMAPAAVGTDTGGSTRIPAALTGTVGFRPTSGRYSGEGIIPISATRDTAGPMARSVADVALLDAVIADEPATLETVSLEGLRLGVPRAHFYENLDPQVAKAMRKALHHLERQGVVLVEADVPDVTELDNASGFPIAIYEVVRDLTAYLAAYAPHISFADVAYMAASPDVSGLLQSLADGTGTVPESVYQDAMQIYRPALQASYANYFAQHDVAAIIYPTTPKAAALIGEDVTTDLNGEQVSTFLTFIRNTDPESVAGIPALTFPVGMTSDGLPIGGEIAGPAGSDRALLAVGAAIEDALREIRPPKMRPRPRH